MPEDRHTRNVTVFPSRLKARRDGPLHQEKQARRRSSQPPRRPGEDEVTYRARILRMQREGKMRRRRQARNRLMLLCCGVFILIGILFSLNLLFRVQEFRIDIGEDSFYYLPPSAASLSQAQAAFSDAPSHAQTESAPEVSAAPQSQEKPPKPVQYRGKPVAKAEDMLESVRYTVQQVLDVLSVEIGSNIFSFSTEQAAARLEEQLPRLEQVKVLRGLPGTVVVQARPAQARYMVQIEEGWAALSDQMKVLEVTAQQPELVQANLGECTLEVGRKAVLNCSPEPVDPTQFDGREISETDRKKELQKAQKEALEQAEMRRKERVRALDTLIAQIQSHTLAEDLTAIDVASELELGFVYQGRVTVRLGTLNQLEYKMQFVAEILKNQLASTDRGTLDASNIRDDGSIQPVFSRE